MRQLWFILIATESNGLILLKPPDTRDGLIVVPTLPQEGNIPLSSTALNDESMQISSIKTTISGKEDVMQISPIKITVLGKEDVMQISPIKRTMSGKEDVMQISAIKMC